MSIKVGNTPLIELKKIKQKFNLPFNIFAKNEGENPTGSIKDRAVHQMLVDDYESKRINQETVIIETTSGNTGIALAYFGKQFGNKVIICMPSTMSKQRREMIAQYGAELVLVEGGMKECNDKAVELHQNIQNSVIFGQFDHKSNPKTHYLHTAPEILNAHPNVKYVFAGIGSGGTISGIAKYIKEHNLDIKIIGIEPSESPLITKGNAGTHGIQGIGANFIPSILDLDKIDSVITVSSLESIEMARLIKEVEGISVGYSSGAALLASINYCKQNNVLDDVVVIFPDKGDRYSWQ